MKSSKLGTLVLTTLLIAGCGINLQSQNTDNKVTVNKSPNNNPGIKVGGILNTNKITDKVSASAIKLSKTDIARLDKEYLSFKTTSLSAEYFQRKLVMLIGNDNGGANGTNIVQELEYARYKTEAVIPFRAMCTADPAFYTTLTGVTAIGTQRTGSAPFDSFISNSNPYPAGATGLNSTAITSTSFSANWLAVPNATAYEISIDSATPINTGNVLTYPVSGIPGLTAGSTHTFKVRAINNTLAGPYSSATSLTLTFTVPTASAATAVTSGGLTANWSSDPDAISGYVLTVKQGSTVLNTLTIPSQATLSQSVPGLTSSTAYTYSVQAKNGTILSAASSPISVSTANGGAVTTLAGGGYTVYPNGNASGGFADATGTNAQFSSPSGVAVDSSGNVYIADSNNNAIRKITSAGVVSTLAGGGPRAFADGTGTNARFGYPIGVAVDSTGTVYVSDYMNNKIRKITSGGVVTTLAGSGTYGFADGPGASAMFSQPHGIAVDSSGNVYVGDSYNHRIRKITSGGVVTTLAGGGYSPPDQNGYFKGGFADGNGTNAKFYNPNQVALDSSGNVYVADYNNQRIRKVTPTGDVTTIAGGAGGLDVNGNPMGGFANGTGTNAIFNYPGGVGVDSAGNVYVADGSNNRIRMITSAGVVSTLAGSGTQGVADGTGPNAQFNSPGAVAVDSTGVIYVADQSNCKIRKIQ